MFQFIKKSFSAKVITLVVVNVVVTSSVIGFATMRSTESFLTEKISEKFPSILLSTKGKVELWYARLSLDLAILSRSWVFLENLEIFFTDRDSLTRKRTIAEITKYFSYIKEKFPVYRELAVLGPDGELIVYTSDEVISQADFLHSVQEEQEETTVFSRAVASPDRSEISQWVLVQIKLSSDFNVTICARICLEDLEKLLLDVGLGPDGDIYILDFRGCFLTQPRKVSINMLGEKAMEVPTRQEGPLVVEKYSNYVHKKVFGSKVFLPERGWWLVCEEGYKRAMAPVLSTRHKILVADFFISAFFVLAALKIIRSILRPVRSLSEGAKKVKEGMVGVNIPEGSEDEVGLMISTFNEMAKTISLAKVELQAKNKILNDQNTKLQRMNERLEELSVTDGLTGLFNHRHFWNIFNSELTRANLYKGELALILLDIDDFKRVNDQFGHAVGDVLLQSIANVLKGTVRETDIVARYGGEEFAVLLPDTNREGVLKVSEKIRKAIESMVFKVPETDIAISITASVGISVFRGNRREFFNSADQALYLSKSKGKNQVSFSSPY